MPVLRVNRSGAEGELQTFVGDIAGVGELVGETGRRRNLHLLQQVTGLLVIVVHGNGQTVVEPSEVDTGIVLCGGLPLDVLIDRSTPVDHGDTAVERTAERIVGHGELRQCAIRADALVTGLTIAQTELQVGEDAEILDELLLAGTPCDGTGEEGSPLVLVGELRATVRTDACGEEIFVHQRVVHTAEEGDEALCTLVTGKLSSVLGTTHVVVLGEVVGEVLCHLAVVIPRVTLHGETGDGVHGVDVVEGMVKCQDALSGGRSPDVAGLAGLAVDRRLTLLSVTVVVRATVRVVVAQSEVLSELQPFRYDLNLKIRAAEIVDAVELILGAAHIGGRVGGEPIEVVGLCGIHVRTVGRREDQCRAHHAGVVAQRVGEVCRAACEALVGTDLQPAVYFARDVGTERVTFVA